MRIKFRIWPGRSGPIESAYKQEMIAALQDLDAEYSDWMVSINTEISETPATTRPYRMPRGRAGTKR